MNISAKGFVNNDVIFLVGFLNLVKVKLVKCLAGVRYEKIPFI